MSGLLSQVFLLEWKGLEIYPTTWNDPNTRHNIWKTVLNLIPDIKQQRATLPERQKANDESPMIP